MQASGMRQLIADKAHQVKESVQGEFDKLQPRNSEDQAWTQGRIVSNTPEVEQRASFDGSRRRIVTEPVDLPEITVSTFVSTISIPVSAVIAFVSMQAYSLSLPLLCTRHIAMHFLGCT